MKQILSFLFTALMLLASTSCSGTVPAPDSNPYKPLSLSTRQQDMVDAGQAFSFELLKRIESDSASEDYVISPLSMQILLGMILNGAKGKTAEEIISVLGYGADQTGEVNEFCRQMLLQLPKLDSKTVLKIANAIYVDKGYKLLPSYNETVTKFYDANVSNLDFTDTKGSAEKINRWCSEHTGGLIPHILDEVSPLMLCYLLDALYFKGEWTDKFSKEYTSDKPFYRLGKEVGKVPMMFQFNKFQYFESDLFQAVMLPYGNGAFSMTVLLPAGKYSTSEVTEHLTPEKWSGILRSMYGRQVELHLPKFETKYHKQLNELLKKMGMPTAFGNSADFKLMSPDALKLSFVQQDAFIRVDEQGAEAAAVSSAGMEKTTAIPTGEPVIFKADHPFIYIISESSTGAILFAGRYSAL